ncbi:vitellin-degrading protease-like [Cimex lectularius]|uniref:Peptidase S1 domain-containing protein n=1 Tax=Cimex lectularius TaxID=79782 RepID=A0A8I6S5A1_CIMLE|nr:vitellin-degrading protease-like [Cimex lectularius]
MMFLLVIGCLISSTSCFGFGSLNNVFIHGGTNTTVNSRQYQVSIQTAGDFACSGALVKPGWVLTIASCVSGYDPNDVLVRAGSDKRDRDGVTRNVKNLVIHPNFTISDNDYDLAVLELSKPFTLTKRVKPIRLANRRVQPKDKVYLSGWGEDENGSQGKFKKLELTVLSKSECHKKYKQDHLSERMLCAWRDAVNAPCWNDFGDPLHNEWNTLVGFYSWTRECKKYPSVYTDLHPLREWVQKYVPNK